MTLDVKSDYVSSPQAAKVLRITSVGVAQLARQGKIPAVKIANRWLIPRAFVKEFARTYEGKRGRPRKSRRLSAGYPVSQSAVQAGLADSVASADVTIPGFEPGEILAANALVASPDVAPPPTYHSILPPMDATTEGESGDSGPVSDTVSAANAQTDQAEYPPVSEAQPDGATPGDAVSASETVASPEPESRTSSDASVPISQPEEPAAATSRSSEVETTGSATLFEASGIGSDGDETFAVSAEVFHLDKNYDFELYEKGRITERARLIVARLKPKIPSLPQFSFRWDYRYEHLNVDIHGVDPAVKDWWTMGENGYTGHLPRRLGEPGYVFEAIIWLPITFVFRGRLTLSLQDSQEAGKESPSVATTTGGLRKLWARWPTFPSK